MKTMLLAAICLGLVSSADGQEPGSLQESVRVCLTSGGCEGQRDKQFVRGGDATAVALTKVIGDKPLSDEEVAAALDILSEAFSKLSWVETPGDREPRTALFVLVALDNSSHNAALKAKISETKRTLVEDFSKFSPK